MIDNCTSKCPRCGRPSSTTTATNNHTYWCGYCRMEFEDCADGDFGYGDPARIAERRERYLLAAQRRQRQQQQRVAKRSDLRGGLGR